jgi:hypothetical protein
LRDESDRGPIVRYEPEPTRWNHLSDACQGSIWHRWLGSVYRRLRQHVQARGSPELSTSFRTSTEHIKREVSDIIPLLLQYDADPTGTLCISDHWESKSCELRSMESILSFVACHEQLGRMHALRVKHSLWFDMHAVHHDYVVRAVAAWTTSRRKSDARTGCPKVFGGHMAINFLYAGGLSRTSEYDRCSSCERVRIIPNFI